MTENTPDAVKVLERLIATARLLYANAEGCAVNHHGADFELHGMPGWLTDCAADIAAAQSLGARAMQAAMAAPAGVSFQDRVQPWMMACFGPEISGDKLERGDRLLEEVLELLQSGDYPRERVAALTDYVWGRPKGEPSQEVGGVQVTLAAYCLAHALDMHEAGETELARIWTKVDTIRAKQAAKPTGSALPIAIEDAGALEGATNV